MPKAKRESPAKDYCFTVNNYDDDGVRLLSGLVQGGIAGYICFGYECGKSGTKHLQGFIQFTRKVRFSTVQASLPKGTHIEKRRGTPEEASEYCKKEGNYHEEGKLSKSGNRSDLEAVAKEVARGASDFQIAETFPAVFVRYYRGLRELRCVLNGNVQRSWKTRCHVYYGYPGSGKSLQASQLGTQLSPGNVYYKPRGEWWDGYESHEVVIIDDFYGWIVFDELLKICDRYPYRVPIKGGYRNFVARDIFITSNSGPDNWYPNVFEREPIKREAMSRRFEYVIEFKKMCDHFVCEIEKFDYENNVYELAI
ncbi:replication-associated protein [Fly associated circular virus 5]|uniref:replication-associated protein n=1 Tax=Fly associated circular virus 5 TaxID=2293285 RepID=UPI000E3341AF|nr:replication-associated protein [Fly associated circular virus 5]AXL65895.1 replication-associated protein [Fly associated circular virus 5]